MCNDLLTKREVQLARVNDHIADTLTQVLSSEEDFTGTIVFTVNCRSGGIGNTEAFVQKKILTKQGP